MSSYSVSSYENLFGQPPTRSTKSRKTEIEGILGEDPIMFSSGVETVVEFDDGGNPGEWASAVNGLCSQLKL